MPLKPVMPKNYFFRIFMPLLIYWGITLLVQFVIAMIYSIIVIMPSVLQQMTEVTEFTNAMYQAMLQDVMTKSTEFISAYILHMTVLSGLATLLYTILAYRKDRKHEVGKVTEGVPGNFLLFEAKQPPYHQYIWVLLLGLVLCYGLNGILLMVQLAFPHLAVDGMSKLIASTPFWLQVVGIGLVAPISEEMLFRGILFRRYRERYPYITATILTSVIFGLMHGSTLQFLYAFVMGLFLCYIYEVYGTMKAPIALHIVINLFSVFATHNAFFSLPFSSFPALAITVVLCALIGSSTIVMLMFRKKDSTIVT